LNTDSSEGFPLKKDKYVIKRLHKGPLIISFPTILNHLNMIEIILKTWYTSRSHSALEKIKELESPRCDLVTVGGGKPSHGHMVSCTVMCFSMIFSCRINGFRQGKDPIGFQATLGTGSPDFDWQESMPTFFAIIVHMNMLGQQYALRKTLIILLAMMIWKKKIILVGLDIQEMPATFQKRW